MVVWSSVFRSIAHPGLLNSAAKPGAIQSIVKNAVQIRQMSDHRTMHIQPSRFQWNKWKDYLHFYTLVGAIPLGTLVLLVNIFVGPATLTPIPEGYKPKHWEYHRHPICRFMARYVFPPMQQDYERRMHVIYVDHEKRQLKYLEEKVHKLIKQRIDSRSH